MYISKKLAEQFLRYLNQSGRSSMLVHIEQYDSTRKKVHLERQLNEWFSTAFSVSWSLGGTSGGYDGSKYEVSAEREPDMEDLDNFLLSYYPTLGFLQYKKIIQQLDVQTSYDSDYYGGSTTSMTKSLSLKNLSDVLTQFGFLDSNDENIELTGQKIYELYVETLQPEIMASIAPAPKKSKKNKITKNTV